MVKKRTEQKMMAIGVVLMMLGLAGLAVVARAARLAGTRAVWLGLYTSTTAAGL